MQIPENPDNNDIREALIELQKEIGLLRSRLEKLESDRKNPDYASSLSSTGTERMVRTSIRVIIATAIIVVLLNWIPAVIAIITALSENN